MVLMLQREVAERISAAPGDMSYLSVFVQFHAAVRDRLQSAARGLRAGARGRVGSGGDNVPRDPTGERPLLSQTDEDELWRVVQAGFRERRKKLHNVLARQLPVTSAEVLNLLGRVGIDGDRRPQTLSVAEWLVLRAELAPLLRAAER
jgi:16S rRNA (adenine1518-N6/adenine1519-N6)-dimethyltransferase